MCATSPYLAPVGKITFKNLKRVAKELGENMTDEELQEMIDEVSGEERRDDKGLYPILYVELNLLHHSLP